MIMSSDFCYFENTEELCEKIKKLELDQFFCEKLISEHRSYVEIIIHNVKSQIDYAITNKRELLGPSEKKSSNLKFKSFLKRYYQILLCWLCYNSLFRLNSTTIDKNNYIPAYLE